jgi:vang-like
VKVVRSPDGQSHSYNIGQLSIQRAAVWILERYYQDFGIYNPYLESLPTKKSRKSGITSNHINSTTAALKYYDVDGMTNTSNNTTAISGSTSFGVQHININNSNRSFINGSTSSEVRNRRERESSSHHHNHHSHHHNERFYEEHEYERRVRKRKARLITATEEAFTHIKRIQDERGMYYVIDYLMTFSCKVTPIILILMNRILC